MATAHSGRQGKPAKLLKKGTATTKSHRFESFSQRVAKLKIDPIHRVRRASVGDDSDSESDSYFRASLEHWVELNLSENFTQFSQRVNRLCESLPQILHHEDRIMGLLAEYIGKRDELSMEPLLSLVAQFARDLGQRFERHFASTVTLVASVAATHPNIEVIEWSFTCLAWIFKFLSRLLVPDLRQLLGIMSPYLGKEKQKHFVTRFAAESMSFLVRKAALVYYKNKAPLDRAVTFLFEDLASTDGERQISMYQQGLMSMFSDAIKGVNGGIHSNGADIIRCLISAAAVKDEAQSALAEQVLSGVVINLVHHTSSNTFGSVLDVICDHIGSAKPNGNIAATKIDIRLIFVAVTARKGSRVSNWKRVHQTLMTLLGRIAKSPNIPADSVQLLLASVVTAVHTSPMDELLSFMRPIMELISGDRLRDYFLPFCSLFSTFGTDRFQSVVLPYFQRFITSFWKDYESGLCQILPKLHAAHFVTSQPNRPGSLNCPGGWKEAIVERFSKLDPTAEDIAFLHSYTKLHEAISLTSEPSILPQLTHCLHDRLKIAMALSPNVGEGQVTFARGQGFLAYVRLATELGSLDLGLWSMIVSNGPECSNCPVFLEATLAYLSACTKYEQVPDADLEPFATTLINNLSGLSHDIRQLSLKILQVLLSRVNDSDSTCIEIAIEIEQSELTLHASRALSMQVRKLAIAYPTVCSKKWLDRIIPNFCFGLLSKRLASLWDDACEAIKAICEVPNGESIVTELAMRGLQEPSPLGTNANTPEEESAESHISSEFECFNVSNVEKTMCATFADSRNSNSLLAEDFKRAHVTEPQRSTSSRTQALKVLGSVPQVAEKRSRQFVPLFLIWAAHDDDIPTANESKPSGTSGTDDSSVSSWNLRDRKAMLDIFGKFVNPKVLYKAAEVHEALLGLLGNGDTEIQKSALKAIFTWKSPAIQPYETNILNIVDDARFRDELSVFLNAGQEASTIKENHRAELFPILLRLLYGKIVARGGSRGGQGTQEARRKTILRTISQLSESDFGHFVQIAFGPLSDIRVLETDPGHGQCLNQEVMGVRKQYGLLKMVETMFETLKTKMSPFVDRSMNVVLYCLVRACRQLNDASSEENHSSLIRNTRQTGVHCLDLIFSVSPDYDWTPYIPLILNEIISPRLGNFAVETAQSVSGLLHLFHTWASSPKSALYFLHADQQVIQRIVDCLGVESAREDVKIFVLNEILNNLVSRANGETDDPENLPDVATTDLIRSKVLAPNVEYILTHVESLLRNQSTRQLTMAAIETLSKLAPFVQSSQETTKLISTATFLLTEPADRVPPKAKSGLLRVMHHFLPLYDPRQNVDLNQRIFEVISSLFDYFKDNPNRAMLSSVLSAFANHEVDLKGVAELCADLNAISEKKLDELDFDRRLRAFNTINEQKYKEFTARQWRPLLFNLLYHVKDEEELAIRSSSSFGLKRFIESVGSKPEGDSEDYSFLLEKALLPALRNGAKHPAEIVRAEFVSVLGYFITHNPNHRAVTDMVDLLAGGDEEASFFNNILHIQQHRRLRALRRLATEARQGKFESSNISSFFLPLIEHYVFDQAEDDSAHNLAAETVTAIGVLSEGLEWSQFRAIFRRYKGYVRSRPGMEKNVIRLLGQMTDGLSRAMSIDKEEQPVAGDGEMEGIEKESTIKSTLSKTLPAEARIGTELKTNFIPFLSEFVHQKDESEVHLRVPVAVITVKLLKLLPKDEMALLLPSVLLDLSNVLRSRSQDARDMARKTLADVALILGPSYFGYILRELRSTLTRGYQLHVLSFTVHSILVATSDHFEPGDLDHSLDALAAVVMDDIFGTVGQEKDAEEYVSKMKEVKSNKSYDSMELLAKISTIRHLSALINPVQALLREKLTATIIRKVDELLRRIGVGLLRNPGAESRDLLVFCYEVIKESYKADTPQIETQEQGNRARFIVNLLNPRNRMNRGSTSSYSYKLSRFGLDVLRSVLNKYQSLMTAANVAGFLPIIGDALLQSYEEVKLSAIRLISTIIKVPLSELDRNSDVYLMEAIKLVKEAPNTNTEAAQAALKLIASILRERKSTKLKDSHLGYLLKRIAADIEEPDRQGVAFNFIRAVMSRKFIVPEMYELVDNVAAMMVTNHTRSARDLARGVFIHFMIEYPQAKSRWTKQLGFLAKNLDYQHKEGRQSVMEAVHLLLSKTNGDPAQDIVGNFFVPVVMVMSNDEAVECREMAGVLLNDLFSRADSEQLKSMLSPLRSWLEQSQNTLLTATGLQAIRIFFESHRNNKEGEMRFVTDLLPRILGPAVENCEGEEWEVLYHSLQLFTKLCQLYPAVAMSEDCENIWRYVCESLFYPHAWIKSCAANLIGIWLADEAKGNAVTGYGSVPLIGASGLKLEGCMMLDITRASLLCLKSTTISEDLATQTIRNLVFLGRCFSQNNLAFSKKAEELAGDFSDDSDDEDNIDPATVNSAKQNKPAIEYIFERAAAILRREPRTTRADSLINKTACMKLLAALCTHLDVAQITPSLQTILLPLIHLTDPSIPAPRSLDEQFQATYKALVSSSQEILDLLQKKLGTTDFVTQMAAVRESVKSRREGRRVKRRIEAVADPEKFGREKKRKNDRKREKRKEKGAEYQDRRRGW